MNSFVKSEQISIPIAKNLSDLKNKAISPITIGGIAEIRLLALDVHSMNVDQILSEYKSEISSARMKSCLKFYFKKDQQCSLGATFLLDYLLQKYGLHEQKMNYEYGPNGKPYFKNYPNLQFSISHSGQYAICAMTENTEVGVDIEAVQSFNPEMAQICMSQEELVALQGLVSIQRDTAFISSWCIKEAVLKVTGKGLDENLMPKVDIATDFCNLADSRYSNIEVDLLDLPFYKGAIAWLKK